MRICIINEFFHPDNTGGTGTVLSSLVRHLREQYPEISIDVITTRSLYRDEEQVLARHEEWHGVRIFRVGVPRPRNASMLPRLTAGLLFSLGALLKLAGRRRYDCVMVTTAPPTLPLATQLGRWITRAPYIYIIYDLFPDVPVALGVLPAQGRIARICRKFQGRWLASASKVVVLGRCMRDHLTRNYKIAADKIEVIPIWSDQTAAPLGTQTKFRREHGLSGPVVLYSGNFGQCQDFDTLLDAARQMRERHSPGTWVFVGEGAKKEHIARRIEEEGLSNVRMFPFVPGDEFADLLATAYSAAQTFTYGDPNGPKKKPFPGNPNPGPPGGGGPPGNPNPGPRGDSRGNGNTARNIAYGVGALTALGYAISALGSGGGAAAGGAAGGGGAGTGGAGAGGSGAGGPGAGGATGGSDPIIGADEDATPTPTPRP